MASLTRSTDKKGRITLPKHFADHLVIIEQVDETEIRVRKAEAVPQRELWLWKNQVAAGVVLRGIAEAKAEDFVRGPDLENHPSENDCAESDHPEQ